MEIGNNIKMDIRKIGYLDWKWTELAQDHW
jgi:hypothetical protein